MKILIIKTGALGDVLRTTTILNLLKNDIVYWLTNENAIELIKDNPYIKQVIPFNDREILKSMEFDLILSLDDEEECCKLVSELNTEKLIGAYYEGDTRTYTEDSSSWFDMGLISKYGLERANQLKKQNSSTYQEHLFRMLQREFNNEPYVLNVKQKNVSERIVGIENRAGDRWPMKQWDKYDELALLLERDGYEINFFEQRSSLIEYIEDVNSCGLIITGDSLALHIALALNKKVIGLFGPTSAEEIYSYDNLIKIKTPTDCYCCYRKDDFNKENCINAIPLEEVYNAVKER